MSIHDYTGLSFAEIAAREAYLERHPELFPGGGRPPRTNFAIVPQPDAAAHAPAESPASPASREADCDRTLPVDSGIGGADAEPASPHPDPFVGRDRDSGRFTFGNPGRPKGALNKSTLLARALIDDEAEHLVRTLIARGMSGDSLALRVAVTRLLPARRDLPVDVALPAVTTPREALEATGNLIAMVGEGRLTPKEALSVSKLIQDQMNAIEQVDFDARLTAIEQRNGTT